jgi:hypothetical protein
LINTIFPKNTLRKQKNRKNITVFQFIAKFIKEAPNRKDKNTGRPLTYNNIQQYKATERHLKDFARRIRKKDFDFSDIDQAFYDKFVAFLQEKSFRQNSVGKHIQVLKLMLNEATTQNYNTNAYYNSFHVFTEETDTIYLKENELQQLKDTDFSKTPYLDRVRDWFLLLAWTVAGSLIWKKLLKRTLKTVLLHFGSKRLMQR